MQRIVYGSELFEKLYWILINSFHKSNKSLPCDQFLMETYKVEIDPPNGVTNYDFIFHDEEILFLLLLTCEN